MQPKSTVMKKIHQIAKQNENATFQAIQLKKNIFKCKKSIGLQQICSKTYVLKGNFFPGNMYNVLDYTLEPTAMRSWCNEL